MALNIIQDNKGKGPPEPPHLDPSSHPKTPHSSQYFNVIEKFKEDPQLGPRYVDRRHAASRLIRLHFVAEFVPKIIIDGSNRHLLLVFVFMATR